MPLHETAAPGQHNNGERPSGERAAALVILQRPGGWLLGNGRRIHTEVDGATPAELAHGATIQQRLHEEPHRLRARCWPLSAGELHISLRPHQVLRLTICVSPLYEILIIPTE